MAPKSTQKFLTLIKEKENTMASEANIFKQMEPHREFSSLYKGPHRFNSIKDENTNEMECESLLDLIQSKCSEVKRLKAELIDSPEIEETSSLRHNAETLIMTTQMDINLVWSNLKHILSSLSRATMLESKVRSLVKKCYFVADQSNGLVRCLCKSS
uniref:Uncharacterized protein n=1 Tax=Oryza brachyantha TaxID=4533 RepID=J3MS89_ORYBR